MGLPHGRSIRSGNGEIAIWNRDNDIVRAYGRKGIHRIVENAADGYGKKTYGRDKTHASAGEIRIPLG